MFLIKKLRKKTICVKQLDNAVLQPVNETQPRFKKKYFKNLTVGSKKSITSIVFFLHLNQTLKTHEEIICVSSGFVAAVIWM